MIVSKVPIFTNYLPFFIKITRKAPEWKNERRFLFDFANFLFAFS